MFDTVRKHQKILQLVLMLFIVPSFALFGISSYSEFMDKETDIVKVNGKPITAQEVDMAAKRQADLDTRSAYLNLSSSVAQIKAYEQALNSSQSQLDSTNLGYEVGVRTSVDVLNAQQQYFSAKRDLLQSRYTYLVNILSLKSAVGLLSEADLEGVNQQLVGR